MGVMSSMRTSRCVRLDGAHHDEAHDHEGRRVLLVRERGEAHRAARAADVLDGRRADDVLLGQHLRHRARGLVPAAARVGRGDEVHGVEGCRGAIRVARRVSPVGAQAARPSIATTPTPASAPRAAFRRESEWFRPTCAARCEIAILLLERPGPIRGLTIDVRMTLGRDVPGREGCGRNGRTGRFGRFGRIGHGRGRGGRPPREAHWTGGPVDDAWHAAPAAAGRHRAHDRGRHGRHRDAGCRSSSSARPTRTA